MFRLFRFIKESRKIIGANANVFEFRRLNSEQSREFSDSKLLGKKILRKSGLPVTKVYNIISDYRQLRDFDFSDLPDSFVLKPNRGTGGGGILVAFSKKNGKWISVNKKKFDESDLREKILDILDGTYSLYNVPDIAFFEERIKVNSRLKLFSYQGLPDIRIIIYNKVPLMAMLRLPTKASNGKANLAQGGIGCGIDLSNGWTTQAMVKGPEFLDYYTESGKRFALRGIKVPYWREVLDIAVKASIASGLTYSGIDITIDKEKGPLVLELNAMPGLDIQNANLAGLKERVNRVKNLKVKTAKKGIQIGVNLFGGDVERELELLSGQPVIGLQENVELSTNVSNEKVSVLAQVDTSRSSSIVDRTWLENLGYWKDLQIFDELVASVKLEKNNYKKIAKELTKKIKVKANNIEKILAFRSKKGGYILRPYVKVCLTINSLKIETVVGVKKRRQLKYKILLGRKDLHHFLINPNENIKYV